MKTILTFLTLTAALFSSTAHAKVNCNLHRIYCAIVKLNPNVDRERAMKASNTLYQASRHYGLDPLVSVAIIHQESGWRFNTAMVVHQNGSVDMGLAQINLKTAKDYNLNVPLLTVDDVYALWAHAKILRKKIRICRARGWARGEEYSCYHDFRKKHRTRYARKVQRWLMKTRRSPARRWVTRTSSTMFSPKTR